MTELVEKLVELEREGSLQGYMARNSYRAQALCGEFLQVFGVSLKAFWSNLTGFDVIAFDEWLESGEDEFMPDVVAARYGEKGIRLVLRLIDTLGTRCAFCNRELLQGFAPIERRMFYDQYVEKFCSQVCKERREEEAWWMVSKAEG